MNTYKLCPEHNGVEIYFERKPDALTIKRLKDNRWRWHHGKECWYNYNSSTNFAFARSLCSKTVIHAIQKVEKEEIVPPVFRVTGELVRCVDCGKKISTHASFCLECGAPMQYILKNYEKKRIRQEQLQLQQQEEARQREKRAEIERKKREVERQKEMERKQREEAAAKVKIVNSFRNIYPIGASLSEETIYSIYQYLNENATKISEWNYKFRERTVIDVRKDEKGKIYFQLYVSQYEREKLYMVVDEKKKKY